MTEHEFQYCWNHVLFKRDSLKTYSGKSVDIIDVGQWNSGPGPDFLEARLLLNGMEFRGAVELHMCSQDWIRHGHHDDPSYNSVVMHVLPLEAASVHMDVLNEAGHTVESLYIQPEWSKKTQIKAPCEVLEIQSGIFEEQLERAQILYLQDLSARFMSRFATDLGFSGGIKAAAIYGLFELLGKPHHQDKATDLADWYVANWLRSNPIERSNNSSKAAISGGRGIGVEARLQRAQSIIKWLMHSKLPVSQADFEDFLIDGKSCIDQQFGKNSWSKHCYRSWLLVLMYSWASLLFSTNAMRYIIQEWKLARLDIPESVGKQSAFKRLRQIKEETQLQVSDVSLFDQYKVYCSKLACMHCKYSEVKTGS